MAQLNLRLLGDFQARLGSGPPLRLRARKTQALLAYLASPPGQDHSRDKLAALLWGDRSETQARGRLRESLFLLRKALASADRPCLAIGTEAVALDANGVEVDAVEFGRLLQQGDPGALAQAVDLYRGDFLEGLAFRGAEFEEWLMGERERLRELAVDGLAQLLAHQHRSGATAETSLQTALRLIALDPLQEPVHRTLMRLYAQLGRRAAALRQYQLCAGMLQRELGVEPEAATRQLYQEILRRRPHQGRVHLATREPGDWPRPARAALVSTPTPLIARDDEMSSLRQTLREACAGSGRLMLIVGEAGVGKTRLVTEIATEASSLDAHVLLGRCYESDQILAFGPWVDALRTSGVAEDHALLDQLAPAWRAELARLLPEAEVPGLPVSADNQLRLFESVARLLERLTARRTTLLALEDLHWADEMSLRLLAFVTRRIPAWPLLLVVTVRDDEGADAPVHRALHALGEHPHARRLLLRPLSRADTARLTLALARVDADLDAVAHLEQQVWVASEGNPFVVVETTRALQEGAITAESQTLPLPERVRELIAGRLERLSVAGRELAAVAAVIGREFDFDLLQHASGLDERAAAEGVEELVRRHVLRGVGERLDFSHERVRAAVYGRLVRPQRRLHHRRIGMALEALHADNLEPYYFALASHYREGEVWRKAVDFFRQAGLKATARSASREAVGCFTEAHAALRHLPDTRDALRLAVELRLEAHGVYSVLGELEQMLALLREAEPLAAALGDQRLMARVASQMAHCWWWKGEAERAVEFGHRALVMAEALGDVHIQIGVRSRLCNAYMDLGEYRRAVEIFRHGAEILVGELARERFDMSTVQAVAFRGFLATSLAILGDFGEARVVMDQALDFAAAAAHPYSLAWAYNEAGRLDMIRGDWKVATGWLERSLELCRREGFPYLFPNAATFLGHVYTQCGRIGDGIALLEEAVQQSATIQYMACHPRGMAHLAEGYLLAGRRPEAMRAGRRALELSRANKQRGFEADVCRILGEVEATNESTEGRAINYFSEYLTLARELGMRPLQARSSLGLGRLLRRIGDRPAAVEAITHAAAMLGEMGMRFWLEQAEAELTLF